MLNIGCIAVVPVGAGRLLGIECAKGRGLILPGGKYERERDKSYHHAAARELQEETGVTADPESLEYLYHGPDGYEYITFAFLARLGDWRYTNTPEGRPQEVTWEQLFASHFGAYYRVLRDVMRDKVVSVSQDPLPCIFPGGTTL